MASIRTAICLLLLRHQSVPCFKSQAGYTGMFFVVTLSRVETESGGTRRRTGGEVKGKEANGVGSQAGFSLTRNSPSSVRAETERDGTRAETRFGFPAKRTSPFISAGVSVQSSTGFLGVRVGRERL